MTTINRREGGGRGMVGEANASFCDSEGWVAVAVQSRVHLPPTTTSLYSVIMSEALRLQAKEEKNTGAWRKQPGKGTRG